MTHWRRCHNGWLRYAWRDSRYVVYWSNKLGGHLEHVGYAAELPPIAPTPGRVPVEPEPPARGMTGDEKIAWREQQEADRDWEYSTDNPRRVGP